MNHFRGKFSPFTDFRSLLGQFKLLQMVTIRQDESCPPGLCFWKMYYSVSGYYTLLSALCLLQAPQQPTKTLTNQKESSGLLPWWLRGLSIWQYDIWEEAKGVASVQSEEEEIKGASNCSLQLLSGWLWSKCMEKASIFLKVDSERSRGNTHKLQKGKFQTEGKIFPTRIVLKYWTWLPRKVVEFLSMDSKLLCARPRDALTEQLALL